MKASMLPDGGKRTAGFGLGRHLTGPGYGRNHQRVEEVDYRWIERQSPSSERS